MTACRRQGTQPGTRARRSAPPEQASRHPEFRQPERRPLVTLPSSGACPPGTWPRAAPRRGPVCPQRNWHGVCPMWHGTGSTALGYKSSGDWWGHTSAGGLVVSTVVGDEDEPGGRSHSTGRDEGLSWARRGRGGSPPSSLTVSVGVWAWPGRSQEPGRHGYTWLVVDSAPLGSGRGHVAPPSFLWGPAGIRGGSLGGARRSTRGRAWPQGVACAVPHVLFITEKYTSGPDRVGGAAQATRSACGSSVLERHQVGATGQLRRAGPWPWTADTHCSREPNRPGSLQATARGGPS